MHSAPAVTYRVGRSRFALAFVVLAWLAGAAGIAAWRLQVAAPPLQDFAAAGVVLAFGAAALRGWLRSPAGSLSWDGAGWTWNGAAGAETGSPRAVLDLQRVMLLRWDCGRITRWLWLERAVQPPSWDDLRRAVYWRVPTP